MASRYPRSYVLFQRVLPLAFQSRDRFVRQRPATTMNAPPSAVFFFLVLSILGGAQCEFVCPAKNGQFASPESCRVFYQCVDNIPYITRCAEGSLYDGLKHECVDKFLKDIKCGPQTTTEAPSTTPDPFKAPGCDDANCRLPYCHCSLDGTDIPEGLRPEEIPQIIMITFDGGVNDLNFETYNKIFLENRTNPNGCPIRGTFFVSHDYTNYQQVQDYYSQGHEIAAGSVSRRKGLEDENEDTWIGEMVTMREILRNYASVRPEDVIGQRGPHLKPGRNAQYEVLASYGFSWDSTINVPPVPVPVWPYSLEYEIPHECRSGTCPSRAFPGVWELPMNSHYKDTNYEGGFCPYLDQCALSYLSEPEVVQWLLKDFDRHYTTNKAPYMLSLTTNWFQTPSLTNGLLAFIDETLQYPDVYYTTMTEALQWVTTPQTLGSLDRFQPWNCKQKVLPEPPCAAPQSCQLVLNPVNDNSTSPPTGSRYMVTCNQCPTVYPWVWDAAGIGRGKDEYVPEYPTDRADASNAAAAEELV
ncbi:chitin deacetylase 1-like [Macrobrachium nipponense]|uniref:chitin deacetylase 1-like n=1 Tax=Macrobrachium nipponense TaxID=159736 RepID=UPI0030C7B1A8